MRRGAPLVLLVVGVALLLGGYVLYTRSVVRDLRRESERTARMFASIYGSMLAQDDPTATLLALSEEIGRTGVPIILTEPDGTPQAHRNLPFDAPQADDPRVRAYVAELDAQNAPVVQPGIGAIHFGDTPAVRSLQVAPFVLATSLALILLAGGYALRLRSRAERERVWAGMARESAHQLGTPLSSIGGWLELLEDTARDGMAATALGHMRADLERLERVAHRFERIGRPPRREPVDVRALVERVGDYFRARVPTLAHSVRIDTSVLGEGLVIAGDPVLLEWALESLMKNSIDALAGRGGTITLAAAREPDGSVRIRVEDDGPGIPRELRGRIFEPGVTTKAHGWGIGLSLARRIVEDNHRGRLALVPTDRGATFDVILR